MFGSDRRGKVTAPISTLISHGTSLRGDVHFSGGLHLEGTVDGSISAEGSDAVLTLSENGKVTGEVRVSNAIVNGTVHGDLYVAERLELAGSARIDGNVHYKILEMAAGAQVNGKMLFQGKEPKRLAPPDLEQGLGDDAEPVGA